MTMPFALPEWVPWWVPLALLLLGLLYALAFLFMPFSVLGLKTRLEVIEARLDEIQNEIRHLALRLPMPSRAPDFDEVYAPRPPPPRAEEPAPAPAAVPLRVEPAPPVARAPLSAAPARPTVERPPIPPAPHDLEEGDRDEHHIPPPPGTRPVRRSGLSPVVRTGRTEPRLEGRSEPRVDWPR